mmetsp:Transcript_12810/g.40899  ORF Transcript_12810/g.40899 Transcript_12810/m.40899 type:complete len:220 (-) Transcript_12810:11-670(-)
MSAMNVFRLGGDLCHVISFIMLFWRLYRAKSASGISLKTQELYLVVFVTRYLDLFTNHTYLFNTVMKVIYLGAAGTIVYFMRYKEPYKSTYDETQDTFLHWKYAVLPCAVLALLVNEQFTVMEIIWTFSIYLEAIAIFPQLIVLQRFGEVENITSNYVFFLGAYRGLYIINWIYRYTTEPHYSHWIVWLAGAVQTALYADFFYYFALSKWYGRGIILPQ